MREALIIAGPLALVLLVLARPSGDDTDRSPPASRHRAPRHRVTRERTHTVQALRWVAGDRESAWHIVEPGPRATRAVCGHHPTGILRSHLDTRAPVDGRRTVCQACCHTARVPIDRTWRATGPRHACPASAHTSDRRAVFDKTAKTHERPPHRGGRHRLDTSRSPEPAWPTRDPDAKPSPAMPAAEPMPVPSPVALAT